MATLHRFRPPTPLALLEVARGASVGLVMMAASPAAGQPLEYRETFATHDARDAAHTTAHWDTETGRLTLFRRDVQVRASLDLGPGQEARAVLAAGGTAYVASDQATWILDVSGGDGPMVTASLPAPGRGLALAGGHLFVADPAGLLRVIDVRDVQAPAVVASHPTHAAHDVTVAGLHAFVADGTGGLRVLDVRQPSQPGLVATLELPGTAQDLEIVGQIVFLAAGEAGILGVDVQDVRQPRLVAAFDTDGAAVALDVDGDLLYVADGDGRRLQLLDIRDPTAPGPVASHSTVGPAHDVCVVTGYAYVAGPAGVELVDVSDPLEPSARGIWETSARSIQLAGSAAFAVGGSSFFVLDVADLVVPAAPLARVETPDQAYEIQVAGDHAFVPDYATGLLVFDLDDLPHLRRVGRFDTPGSAVDVALAGDVAYVADHRVGGIQVLDVGDPHAPTGLGSVPVSSAAVAIETAGDLLCVGFIHDGLATYDVSDPARPRLLGTAAAGSVRDIVLERAYAFVADNDAGLRVLDVSEPSSPRILATRTTPGRPTGVAKSGPFVYVADGQGGVQVFDAGDPADPVWIAAAETPGYPFKLEVVGDHLFVADHVAGGLQILDVKNPAAPRVVTGYVTGFYADAVAVAGDHALLADGRGLQLVQAFRRRPYVDGGLNQARSTVIPAGGTAVLVRLRALEQGSLRWQVCASAGEGEPARADAAWQDLSADGTWTPLQAPGDSLRWQAWLESDDASCEQLDLAWRTDAPVLREVEATSPDRAGPLRVRWVRSGYDGSGAARTVFEYDVEQREGGQWRAVATVVANGREEYETRIPAVGADAFRIRGRTADGVDLLSRVTTWTPPLFSLGSGAPNPFSRETTIVYDVPAGASFVDLRIYDLRGRLVSTLVRGPQTPGRKRASWRGTDEWGARVAAGTYLVELRAPGARRTQKIMVLD